jgi:hypothetical protein
MSYDKFHGRGRYSGCQLVAASRSMNSCYYEAAPFLLSKTPSGKSFSSIMLQKTSSRLKNLISPRKSQDNEEDMSPMDQQDGNKSKPSRVRSWTQRPSGESQFLPRDEYMPRKSLSPQDNTAHSSESSLCSCDCDVGVASDAHSHSLSQNRAHSAPQSQSEILYLQAAKSSSFSGDARTWRLIFSELASQSPLLSFVSPRLQPSSSTSTTAQTSRSSTLNLLEALAIEPLSDDEETPTPSISTRNYVTNMERRSDSVPSDLEALALKTDSALKAASSSLADAKASTEGFQKKYNSQAQFSQLRQVLKKQRKVPMSRTKSKARRKKVGKKKSQLLETSIAASKSVFEPASAPLASTNPRWTMTMTEMTDNMAGIFSGRIFNKGHVEEMYVFPNISKAKHEITKSGSTPVN